MSEVSGNRIIALDPGNSTGWVVRRRNGSLEGGTISGNHLEVWILLDFYNPDIIVFETFQMYPGKAQKLIWNTFYPCEVIGVIKLWAMKNDRPIVGLQPSVKKYALSNTELELWRSVVLEKYATPTEHLRDAVRLLRYYERNSNSLKAIVF